MKNNKTVSKSLYLLLLILLGLMLILGILGIVLLNRIIIIVSLVLVVLAFILGLYLLINYLRLREDITIINKKLDDLYVDNSLIVSVSKDEEMKNIFYQVNDLAIRANTLDKKSIYIGNNFIVELTKLLNKGYLSRNFAYTRMYDLEDKNLILVKKRYSDIYIARGDNYYDIVFNHMSRKLEFEDFLREISVVHTSKLIVLYSREFSLQEMIEYLATEKEENKLVIHHKEVREDSFETTLKKYEHVDLYKENLVNDFLTDMLKFLPFSHIAVKVDDEYYLVATYKSNEQINRLSKKDFVYFKERPFFTYDGKVVQLVFASKERIFFNTISDDAYNQFLIYLKYFLIANMNRDQAKGYESTITKLEEASDNLSYEVDKNFIIKYASKKLNLRFNNELLGKKCYAALYDRDEPCANCPFRNNEEQSTTFLLGSNKFTREISFDNDKNVYKIILINDRGDYVSSKEELYERLLGLINGDERGYLLCFKLEALEGLASRNKTDIEDIVKEIINLLRTYGLSDHLYRKEVDEFVYILEEASVGDAIAISKQVSRAFLEKFNTNNKEISFTPKMILLSYPLEVNTIFSLESLCRTMFMTADKKGRLFRVDEEPMPVDNNRYYMELVEESYKQNNIPLSFHEAYDLKESETLYYAHIDYKDHDNKPIAEREITLYAKINNVYLTLVERVSKALIDLEGDKRYILPVGKEALVPHLFASLVGYFTTQKKDLNKIIFEIQEKDAYNHKEEVEKILESGINLAIVIKDNALYDNLDLSKYIYIKIDGKKILKDPLYQDKINKLIKLDKDIMTMESDVDVLANVRYIDRLKEEE